MTAKKFVKSTAVFLGLNFLWNWTMIQFVKQHHAQLGAEYGYSLMHEIKVALFLPSIPVAGLFIAWVLWTILSEPFIDMQKNNQDSE